MYVGSLLMILIICACAKIIIYVNAITAAKTSPVRARPTAAAVTSRWPRGQLRVSNETGFTFFFSSHLQNTFFFIDFAVNRGVFRNGWRIGVEFQNKHLFALFWRLKRRNDFCGRFNYHYRCVCILYIHLLDQARKSIWLNAATRNNKCVSP